ncbi:hypothetical protein FB451DRAFT_1570974 [Mycena latifolia]|nr:hypothetical protein FB451DRAFT_1570974 [Mycena latifolia]
MRNAGHTSLFLGRNNASIPKALIQYALSTGTLVLSFTLRWRLISTAAMASFESATHLTAQYPRLAPTTELGPLRSRRRRSASTFPDG